MEQFHEAPALPTQPERDEGLDTACYSLRARVKARQGRDYGGVGFKEATSAIMQVMDVAHGGPTGLEYRKAPVSGLLILCPIAVVVASLLGLFTIMVLTRVYFQEIMVLNGVLFVKSSSAPAYPGEEPVASTAGVYQSRPLSRCPSLPMDVLRNTRDVVVASSGAWRSIRVARVLRYSDSHVSFEAFDGTAVHVNHNEAYLRVGALGDEERIDLAGSHFRGEHVIPTAFFEAVAVRSS